MVKTYEFIIKQEHFAEDSKFVLDSIGFFDAEIPHANRKGKENGGKLDLSAYCELSDEQIDKIHEFYSDDFEIFGYEKFDRMVHCE